MTCKTMLELVEPIAAGDREVDAALRAHLETCPGCSAALASARHLESALAAREAPPAPEHFRVTVMQRIRRDHWRAEQHVDRVFNLAMAAALVVIAGGIFALMNLGGVVAAAGSGWSLLTSMSGQVAHAAAPTLNTYLAAAALLVSALGMWWWAERRLSI